MGLRRLPILTPRRQALAGVLAVLLALAVAAAGPGAASAADVSGTGTCSASIAGHELGKVTATVDRNGSVRVGGSGPGATNVVSIRYAGVTVASERVASGGSTTVSVPHYASVPGLYEVVWTSLGTSCSITGAVKVGGSSFLGSPLGWSSAATIGLALPLLLTLGWKTTINPRGRWKVKGVVRGEVKREEDAWKLRVGLTLVETLAGTLLGLLLGGATLATLSGTATSVPSFELALEVAAPLTAIGFLLGLGRLRPPRERRPSAHVAVA